MSTAAFLFVWLSLVAVTAALFVYLQVLRFRQAKAAAGRSPPLEVTGDRNRWVAIILALLLGDFGLHKFYLGDRVDGAISLCLCCTGIPAILALLDVAFLLTLDGRGFDQLYNAGRRP